MYLLYRLIDILTSVASLSSVLLHLPWERGFSLKYLEEYIRDCAALVEIFSEDEDPPNCYPFTPFLVAGPGSFIPFFLRRVKRDKTDTITHALTYFDKSLGVA